MKTIQIRTLTELSQLDGRVYVHMKTSQTEEQFLRQAEAEGFTFTNGGKPTNGKQSNFMAINSDHTINYIGVFGRMAYSIKEATVDGQRLFRILYNGDEAWHLEE